MTSLQLGSEQIMAPPSGITMEIKFGSHLGFKKVGSHGKQHHEIPCISMYMIHIIHPYYTSIYLLMPCWIIISTPEGLLAKLFFARFLARKNNHRSDPMVGQFGQLYRDKNHQLLFVNVYIYKIWYMYIIIYTYIISYQTYNIIYRYNIIYTYTYTYIYIYMYNTLLALFFLFKHRFHRRRFWPGLCQTAGAGRTNLWKKLR